MTTATAGRFDGLKEVEQRLAEAQEERTRLDEQRWAHVQGIRKTEAELRKLAGSDPGQFGPDGQPRPKTKAAALRRQLEQAESSQWPALLAGAEQRIAELEAEARRLTNQYAVELAAAEFRAAEDALAGLDQPAQQLLAVIDTLKAHEARLIQITSRTSGQRLDGRDVFWDQRLDQLRVLLEQVADFKPPRSVTLSPLVGEQPILQRGTDGGWTLHGEPGEDQPEKLEPRR